MHFKAKNLRIPKHPRLLFLAQNLGVLQPSKTRSPHQHPKPFGRACLGCFPNSSFPLTSTSRNSNSSFHPTISCCLRTWLGLGTGSWGTPPRTPATRRFTPSSLQAASSALCSFFSCFLHCCCLNLLRQFFRACLLLGGGCSCPPGCEGPGCPLSP